MKFRTELAIKKSKAEIDYSTNMIFLGSCFAENIGGILRDHKFNTLINPLGISYNPYSLYKHLSHLDTEIHLADLEKKDDKYFHFDYHTDYSHKDSKELIFLLAEAKKRFKAFLQKTEFIFISLGTAFVFKREDHGIVNNCHKLPGSQFNRILLSYQQISEQLEGIKNIIRNYAPSSKIVFTISPIRHLRDGLIEDRKSKSLLNAALHDAIDDQRCFYFPSYELLIDDLRDYRFYSDDLIHPSSEAISYIWEAFKNTYFSETTISQIKSISKIINDLNHRPSDPESAAHQIFLKKILKNLKSYEELDFSHEKEIILRQIIS